MLSSISATTNGNEPSSPTSLPTEDIVNSLATSSANITSFVNGINGGGSGSNSGPEENGGSSISVNVSSENNTPTATSNNTVVAGGVFTNGGFMYTATGNGASSPTPPGTGNGNDIPNDPGKMFIGGLSWQTTPESIREYFSEFGELAEVMVMKDPATRRSRGFGFITFSDPAAVEKVLKFPVHQLDGKLVEPKVAVPRKTNPKMVMRTKKIFVGGLSATTSLEDIRAYFEQFSKVKEAMLAYDKVTNRHRGFGFVTFDNEDVVDKICEIHFHEINGKMVESKKALPKEPRLGYYNSYNSPYIHHGGPFSPPGGGRHSHHHYYGSGPGGGGSGGPSSSVYGHYYQQQHYGYYDRSVNAYDEFTSPNANRNKYYNGTSASSKYADNNNPPPTGSLGGRNMNGGGHGGHLGGGPPGSSPKYHHHRENGGGRNNFGGGMDGGHFGGGHQHHYQQHQSLRNNGSNSYNSYQDHYSHQHHGGGGGGGHGGMGSGSKFFNSNDYNYTELANKMMIANSYYNNNASTKNNSHHSSHHFAGGPGGGGGHHGGPSNHHDSSGNSFSTSNNSGGAYEDDFPELSTVSKFAQLRLDDPPSAKSETTNEFGF